MGTQADPVRAPTLQSMVPSMFLPAMVYEIGNGAVAPVIATRYSPFATRAMMRAHRRRRTPAGGGGRDGWSTCGGR